MVGCEGVGVEVDMVEGVYQSILEGSGLTVPGNAL
jgi:hypothetical protein